MSKGAKKSPCTVTLLAIPAMMTSGHVLYTAGTATRVPSSTRLGTVASHCKAVYASMTVHVAGSATRLLCLRSASAAALNAVLPLTSTSERAENTAKSHASVTFTPSTSVASSHTSPKGVPAESTNAKSGACADVLAHATADSSGGCTATTTSGISCTVPLAFVTTADRTPGGSPLVWHSRLLGHHGGLSGTHCASSLHTIPAPHGAPTSMLELPPYLVTQKAMQVYWTFVHSEVLHHSSESV